MKKTNTVLLAVLALFILSLIFKVDNCSAQWQSDVRLTNQPDSSMTHIVSGGRYNIAANGNAVHTVWFDTRDGNKEIYYKHSTDGGTNWSPDTRLTNAPDNSYMPSIAVSGSIVHVVWWDRRLDNQNDLYYKRSTDGGITWGADIRLTFDPASSSQASIVASGNFVFIAFHDSRVTNWQIYYKISTDGGLNWTSDTRLTNTTINSWYPSVAISGSNIHVVWFDDRNGNSEIYFKSSTDAGLTWGADVRLTNDPAISNYPTIAVSGSNVHVTWYDFRNGNWEIYYKFSADAGINWDVDTRLTNDPASSLYPSIAATGSFVNIIWSDTRDGNNEIYYKQSTTGGLSWGTDTRLTNNPSSSLYPSLAVSGSVVHTVWTDNRDGNYEIYYKRNPTGITGISNINPEIPKAYSLNQNYPNPFNPVTKINFNVPKQGFVSLKVFDVLGREVSTLVNEIQEPGSYSVDFNGSSLTSGVYFYRLQSNGFIDIKKMTLIK